MNKRIDISRLEKGMHGGIRRISAPLELFFAPRSVAVVGASPKPGNQGGRIVASLVAQGFKGSIVPVHPRGETVSGCPAASSVEELGEGIDLAILAVPASAVPGLLEPLARKGIHHAIVISGGFAETGPAGEQLQREMEGLAQKLEIRLIGPNGLGVFSAPDRFNSFFLSPGEIRLPDSGSVAMISQSGAFLSLILDRLAGLGVGVHRAVNFGNRSDVDECELMDCFAADPEVKVIGLYLESVKDGPRFVEAATRAAGVKPVVIWKGGHGARGADAARAHSASLAGSYEVFQSACARSGLIEVQGFEEFTVALQALAWQVPAAGNRVLIVSNGGGMGVYLTDLCERAGLEVPKPPLNVLDQLAKQLPGYYSFLNPVDLTGSGTNEQCAAAVDILLASGGYDTLLMVLLSGTEGITPSIGSILGNRLPDDIPVIVSAYGRNMGPEMRKAFLAHRIPVFDSAESAVRALELLVKRGKRDASIDFEPDVSDEFYDATLLRGWSQWLHNVPDEMECKNFLKLCGVEVPGSWRIEQESDLDTAANQLGFPVVLKRVGKQIRHKTEVMGIRLDIPSREKMLQVWNEMSHGDPEANPVWAEQQMPPGLDLMVGTHRDPQFGPVLVFGTGGQYVEIYRDIARTLIPAEPEEFRNLVFRTHVGQIIRGVRGQEPMDLKRLLSFLKLVADWMVQEPRLGSMDFNPVRLYTNGLIVLDAKITLEP